MSIYENCTTELSFYYVTLPHTIGKAYNLLGVNIFDKIPSPPFAGTHLQTFFPP